MLAAGRAAAETSNRQRGQHDALDALHAGIALPEFHLSSARSVVPTRSRPRPRLWRRFWRPGRPPRQGPSTIGPAISGANATGETSYLDEPYRARAEKAAITYVDIISPWADQDERGDPVRMAKSQFDCRARPCRNTNHYRPGNVEVGQKRCMRIGLRCGRGVPRNGRA
jgi:hypothetical protein